MAKNKKIEVQGVEIRISIHGQNDFICLNDLASNYENGGSLIEKWMRNKNTLEFIEAWESLHNDNFNSTEFEGIKSEAGTNRFAISVKQLIERTNLSGITAKAGRYGGTYAHKDIAFEFAAWLSPVFKLYLIKEYQRLKKLESHEYNLEWSVKRTLAKVNYVLHTNAVKEHIIPKRNFSADKEWIAYAEEGDLLNVALFGFTAKQWRDSNPKLALEGCNVRDIASINELTVLSNLENLNSVMISQGISKSDRFGQLRKIAKDQLKALNQVDFIKSLKYTSNTTYPIALEEASNNMDEESKSDKKPKSSGNKPEKKNKEK